MRGRATKSQVSVFVLGACVCLCVCFRANVSVSALRVRGSVRAGVCTCVPSCGALILTACVQVYVDVCPVVEVCTSGALVDALS